jgi:lysyl-tRNA synthetase class 2
MAELIRAIVLDAADAAGVEEGTALNGSPIDIRGDWRTVTIHDAVAQATGEPVTADSDADTLRALAERVDVPVKPDWSAGELVLELFEKLVEHTLIQPTFVRDYPAEVRPLARPHRDDPRLSEAWDLVIGGVEVGVAYSELVDPVEQRRRLVEQSLAAANGDPEAMELDEDFLRALEYGMPPTGGLGMGVDRLLMVLTGKGIRETILFPLVKPL